MLTSCVVPRVGSELGFRDGHNLLDVGIVEHSYMSQTSKSWYFTCSRWMEWRVTSTPLLMGPLTLGDAFKYIRVSHQHCDVFIQDFEEEAMELIKVGEKYHWTNSKESPNMVQEVEVVWIGAGTSSYDGPVVLIDVPNREYYKRYVLVPARVLRAKPGPCSATMRVAGVIGTWTCEGVEGHVSSKHKTRMSIVTPGGRSQLVEVHWE